MTRTTAARSRDNLGRGLLASGAIHLALLYLVLHLPSGADETLVRSYSTPADIFHEPVVTLQETAPKQRPATAPPRERGVITPVIERPELSIPSDPFSLSPPTGPETGTRGTAGTNPSGPPVSSPEADDGDRIFQVNQVDVPPVPTYAPKPPYPEIAREAMITGRVMLRVLVRADGSVGRVEVTSGTRILSDAAQEALYRWRFRPARASGRAVPVWVEVPVVFML